MFHVYIDPLLTKTIMKADGMSKTLYIIKANGKENELRRGVCNFSFSIKEKMGLASANLAKTPNLQDVSWVLEARQC